MGIEQVFTNFKKDIFKTKCARDYIKYKQTKLPNESQEIIKFDLNWYSAFCDLWRYSVRCKGCSNMHHTK